LGQPPSSHTLKTPYFPLALYERDAKRARELNGSAETALRFNVAESMLKGQIKAVRSAIQEGKGV